jgi:CHAT domain-containing protein
LATHSLAHLACHGAPPDLTRPSATGLVLHDGILSVARIAEARHGHGEFAFLSACHSHTAGDRGVDEVITLAAAFHYTGWRHVIATLWGVKDRVSVTVADHLYAALSGRGHLQPRQAAQALHTAVRRLRANWPDHPAVWASFVHIGP